jgi:multiple sugar transport system permease protein
MATKSEATLFQSYRDTLFEFLSRKRVLAAITVIPALLLFAFITVIPIFWMIYAGFHSIPIYGTTWEWVSLDHYSFLLQWGPFWDSLWRGAVFAAGSVALQVTTGVGLALLLNKSFKYQNMVRAIAMLPYMIPTAVLGFIALWMTNGTWGVLNVMPQELGLITEPIYYFGSEEFALLSVIVTGSWKWSIFVTIFVLARLQSIPDGFYEAARMAGASSYQMFRDITLPNIKGVIYIVVLLRGIWMFNKFDIVWVLTQGGPGDSTTTAAVQAYLVAFARSNLGQAAAFSTLLFIVLAAGGAVYLYKFRPEQEVQVE